MTTASAKRLLGALRSQRHLASAGAAKLCKKAKSHGAVHRGGLCADCWKARLEYEKETRRLAREARAKRRAELAAEKGTTP